MRQSLKLMMLVVLLSSLVFSMGLMVHEVKCQEVLAWEATQFFQYNIEGISLGVNPATGKKMVTVLFSVTNPKDPNKPYWDIKNDPQFKQPAGVSRLAVDVGWNTLDYNNTGSANESLSSILWGGGAGAALPISVNALTKSTALGGGKYQVTTDLPSPATHTGVIAIEGHPAWQVNVNGTLVWERVPVKSVYQYFSITDTTLVPRREVVNINKCKVCHDGNLHDGVEIPRLTLHGGNRTEELHVCVICHNPNQTDITYRTSGAEVSVDFKRMVHSIHAGGFRENPFIVIGFNSSVNDFSTVRFPAELRNCLNCHIEINGKGTFELPLQKSVRGSTIDTRSVPGVSVDVDPANDLKITPIAAVCSSCHDKSEVISHMISKGASFRVLQPDIDSGHVKERCADCHGPGRREDVRRVHEVGGEGGD